MPAEGKTNRAGHSAKKRQSAQGEQTIDVTTDLMGRLVADLPASCALREETGADRDFVAQLYASTRADELKLAPWTPEDKQAFLRSQFELQYAHYREHYRNANFWLITRADRPIGRLYLQQDTDEIRLMDIALTPEQRGQGLGTSLMTAVLAQAKAKGARVTLHVEPLNPAQRLYHRLGFRLVAERGIYHFLEWNADSSNPTS